MIQGIARDLCIYAIFDKEKEQQRIKEAQLIAEIGSQMSDILRTEGQIAGEKAKVDPDALQAAKETLAGKGILNPTDKQIADQAYDTAMLPFGTGSFAPAGYPGGDSGDTGTGGRRGRRQHSGYGSRSADRAERS